ncbi:MAG TPA: histidine phosphatase family protein [Propioniciclava sp.]|jgi:broad specificity phosphatase PhoE|uniref:histidine phosphatase family protein n=1 Tax=Propioniciclava sp. TaxID=2038686 RepID=UPI002B5671FF|nr:histidine phosphatase family protein [Propioniciclava sp.]HRL49338.1 histidine phosphatase family protein [Propioniciclava sp.]HRL79884.1 histidine phosphatase family protein [Propioniciclava sp.]
MQPTIVHVCRHGQVDNPDHILYGRLPGYGLSALGHAMAERLGEHFADAPLVQLRVSPLQRAKETLAPIAAAHPDLEIIEDARLIETANILEGQSFGRFNQRLLLPRNLWHLRNPLRPSWGEPYPQIAQRMRAAIADAAASVPQGSQVLIVSHQLPIYIARLDAEGRSFVHNPATRDCRLASVTAFHVIDGRVAGVEYSEPAADLYPAKKKIFRPGM